MKRGFLIVSVLVMAAMCAQIALGAGQSASKGTKPAAAGRGPMPSGVAVESTQTSVTVVAVDYAKRLITLRLPDGSTQTYKVGPQVKRLNEIKKGDQINATVIDSAAIYVQKGGGAPAVTETEKVTLAPRGGKPGMVASRTFQISGKIQYIDYNKRTVTITGPNYGSRTFKVSPDVQNLQNVRPGDNVVLRYTESIALDVEPPR